MYLLKQVEQNNAPISVMGIQISQSLLGIWGLIFLLCVQLYFCMHYQTLVDKMHGNKIPVFPWIGLYTNKASVAIFHLSECLPVAVCLIMIERNGIGEYGFRLLFVAVAISLFIWTELIYHNYRKL